MPTVAYFFIIVAALIVRGVVKGRATDVPGDLRDVFIGVLTGDLEAAKEAVNRTGSDREPVALDLTAATGAVVAGAALGTGSGKGVTLLAKMHEIGAGKPYRFGGTFANGGGGDCSGLVWRAGKILGYWGNPRFTTATFPAVAMRRCDVVSTPAVGDIVVWQRGGVKGHMGVVSGDDRFYSALSSDAGVTEAKTSAISGRRTFYRLK